MTEVSLIPKGKTTLAGETFSIAKGILTGITVVDPSTDEGVRGSAGAYQPKFARLHFEDGTVVLFPCTWINSDLPEAKLRKASNIKLFMHSAGSLTIGKCYSVSRTPDPNNDGWFVHDIKPVEVEDEDELPPF